jgi:phage shock protein C
MKAKQEQKMSEVQSRPEQSNEAKFHRGDHLFGVCQAIGEDLGFDPLYLRVALFSLMFFNPLYMLGAYAGLAIVLGISRWVAPKAVPAEEQVKTFEQPANEQSEQVQLAA